MKIMIDDLVLTGSAIDILKSMQDNAIGFENKNIEEYFLFMCSNYYKITGKKINATSKMLEDNCKNLFDSLRDIGALEYLDEHDN